MATIPQPMPDQNAAQGSPVLHSHSKVDSRGNPRAAVQQALCKCFWCSGFALAKKSPSTILSPRQECRRLDKGSKSPSGACNTTAAAASITASVLNH